MLVFVTFTANNLKVKILNFMMPKPCVDTYFRLFVMIF